MNDTSARRASEIEVLSLEIVELELALRHQDFLEKGFEGAVLDALEHIGGTMLFRMRMGGISGCDWVAAVALNNGMEKTIAIVAQPTDGGPLRVEDARSSLLPVAPMAAAFAEVVQRLDAHS